MRIYGDISPLEQPGRHGERVVHETLSKCFSGDERWLAIYGMAVLQLTDKVPCPDDPRRLAELDFLVIHREFGVLLVEVKGGQIRCSDLQWESGFEGRWRPLKRSPMQQAIDGLYALLHRASATPAIGSLSQLILHAPLVAFPNIDRLTPLPSDLTPDSVAYAATCTDPAVMERWLAGCFHRLQASQGMRSRGHAVKALLAELVMPVITSEYGIRRVASRLDEEDRRPIHPGRHDDFVRERELRTRVLVHGPAGSGKTIVGMIRAARMLESQPGTRALILTYNKLVAARTQSAMIQTFGERVTVDAYHPFAEAEARRAGITLSEPSEQSQKDVYFREVVPHTLERALGDRGPDDPRNYDLLVVDEAQDFNWRWLVSLEGLLKPNAVRWALYDPQQFIFGSVASEASSASERISEMQSNLIQSFGEPDRLLRCYRSSRSIFRYLQARELMPSGIECDSLAYEGVEPTEETVPASKAADAVKSAAAGIIAQLGIPPQQILVQTKHRITSPSNPLFGQLGRFADGRYRLAEFPGEDGERADAVPCVTISRYKGCERAAAIVVETRGMQDSDGGNLLYTALTRARLHLHVVRVQG